MDTKTAKQVTKAVAASEALKPIKTNYAQDSKNRIYPTHPGYRSNGPRKQALINKVNLHLAELGAKGVNVLMLLKLIGVEGML